MKNSKYIKVSVSERKPETAGNYNTEYGLKSYSKAMQLFIDDNGEEIYPEYWLQEVPDYEDEMKEMLAKCMLEFGRFKAEFGQGSKLELEIKSLLTKLKTES